MSGKKQERRGSPRVEAEIEGPIVGHKGHESIALQTYNISASGLYCRVPQYVAPFTRLKVAMFLPVGDAQERVEFQGAVVRADPEEPTAAVEEYHLAIFFEGLTDEAQSVIRRYLARRG